MAEQSRQALIGLCKIEIKRWKLASESNPNMSYMVDLMEIAMESLTAERRWIKCNEWQPLPSPPED